jgi:hypothetical protein
VACGAKRLETRSWRTKFRGLIAIHSARYFAPEERALAKTRVCWKALQDAALNPIALPLGRILAVVRIADCLDTEAAVKLPAATKRERVFGDFSPGRYAFQFVDLRRLPSPIPASGQRMLWRMSDSLIDQIRRQLEITNERNMNNVVDSASPLQQP